MKGAQYTRAFRPTILLGILIFLLAVFLPLDNANCETDRTFIEINSKYTDGPVVVPKVDYGEPGHDPFGVSFSGNILEDDPTRSIDNYVVFHNKISAKKDILWFLRLFLNQPMFFAH